jgi:exonuclease SbcC
MKILRISLRNLASLEGTHTVDFTQEPLRSAGLFSICGPTGSGKSTLLDALCVALYEQTPRLNAAKGLKLQDGATSSSSISQKESGNLLRRGTGEGFAEVAFIGVDGEAYTARWQIRRARGLADKPLQNSEMTLLRGDVPYGIEGGIQAGGRRTEVLAEIQSRIGLSFEQFTRAVLLAQNDFASFLKADDKERAEILQALTGTERFEAISRQVLGELRKKRRRWRRWKPGCRELCPLLPKLGPRPSRKWP